jgi:hypothetical protein
MWSPGDVVVFRQVVNDGRAWLSVPVIAVRDSEELLVTYTPTGAPFDIPPGPWPTADGRHPWQGRTGWQGHGMLALHRPGEWHAVCAFWHGPAREFSGWYVNIQEPFRRTELGFDTQDLELDIWIPRDGSWEWKDEELLDQRVQEGRNTADQMAVARAEGARVVGELDAGRRWWDETWADWSPDPSWPVPAFPAGFAPAAL